MRFGTVQVFRLLGGKSGKQIFPVLLFEAGGPDSQETSSRVSSRIRPLGLLTLTQCLLRAGGGSGQRGAGRMEPLLSDRVLGQN